MLEVNVDAARFSGNRKLQIYTQTNEFIDWFECNNRIGFIHETIENFIIAFANKVKLWGKYICIFIIVGDITNDNGLLLRKIINNDLFSGIISKLNSEDT